MAQPRVMVLKTAGTNCDVETQFACQKAGMQADVVHVNRVVEKPALLEQVHFLVLPGGFSYGDDLGAGKVVANELQSRLADPLRRFVEQGKLLLGVCNGFQILVQGGFLPDPLDLSRQGEVTLTWNDSHRFEDRWIVLKISSQKSEFLKEGNLIELPIAHGEGKFLPRDPAVLDRLKKNGQVVLQYVDPGGNESGYPWNPNGSVGSVAGLCDPTGRVLGLMPHPERFCDPLQHPQWTRRGTDRKPDGLPFFENAAAYIKKSL